MTFLKFAGLVTFAEQQPELPKDGEGSEESSEKILRRLHAEPKLTAKTLAEELDITSRAVEKQINLLKKEGQLRRIGPAKGGHWEVSK